jgi:hypothetical protein
MLFHTRDAQILPPSFYIFFGLKIFILKNLKILYGSERARVLLVFTQFSEERMEFLITKKYTRMRMRKRKI